MKYIALLRGINVGGKNQIAMPALRAAFEAEGFADVSSYINSGNIIFSAGLSEPQALGERCRALILRRFGLDIVTAVFPARALADALSRAPEWWNADPESKHNALFVIPPATAEQVCALVGEPKPEYERIEHRGPVIFWSAPLKTFSRTRWSKITGTEAYASITIRNANTARKLMELASAE